MSHDQKLARPGVAVQDPSFLVVGGDLAHVHLEVDEASRDELKDRYEEQHLVENGQDECREPRLTVSNRKVNRISGSYLPNHRHTHEVVGRVDQRGVTTHHPWKA